MIILLHSTVTTVKINTMAIRKDFIAKYVKLIAVLNVSKN